MDEYDDTIHYADAAFEITGIPACGDESAEFATTITAKVTCPDCAYLTEL